MLTLPGVSRTETSFHRCPSGTVIMSLVTLEKFVPWKRAFAGEALVVGSAHELHRVGRLVHNHVSTDSRFRPELHSDLTVSSTGSVWKGCRFGKNPLPT